MTDFIPAVQRRRYEEVFAETLEPVRRYLRRRTDQATAEDVTSETMLVLWRRLDEVPVEEGIPWAIGVARLQLQNAERSRRRQSRLIGRIIAVDPPTEAAPPVADADVADEVAQTIASMRQAEAEILRLWAWEELTPSQIASVLAITPNAASIRLHRAKKNFAELHARSRPTYETPFQGESR